MPSRSAIEAVLPSIRLYTSEPPPGAAGAQLVLMLSARSNVLFESLHIQSPPSSVQLIVVLYDAAVAYDFGFVSLHTCGGGGV